MPSPILPRLLASFIGLVLLVGAIGCAHKNSQFIHNERFELKLDHGNQASTNTIDSTDKNLSTFDPVDIAVGFAYDQAVKAVEKEASKYTATFEAKISGFDFYKGKKIPPRKLIFKRFASQSPGDTAKETLELEIAFEASPHGDVMFLTPTKLSYQRSKAKVADASILSKALGYLNDTYTGQFSSQIDITLLHAFVANGTFTKEVLAKLSIPLEDIPIDKGRTLSASIPFPKDALLEKNDYLKNLRLGPIGMPRLSDSVLEEELDDDKKYGNYEIIVSVTETNELGTPLKDAAESLKEKKDTNVGRISRKNPETNEEEETEEADVPNGTTPENS